MAPFEGDMEKEKKEYIAHMTKEITSNTGGMLGVSKKK
jgi:hypothetical protein